MPSRAEGGNRFLMEFSDMVIWSIGGLKEVRKACHATHN